MKRYIRNLIMKFGTVVLLSIFLYSIIGYYFTFTFRNLENKIEMHELLYHNTSLKILHIQKTDMAHVVFYDNDEEVSYYGNRYDIKEKKVDGNTITLQCIPDNFETNLFANLCDNILNNLDTKSPNGKRQKKSFKKNVKDLFLQTNVHTDRTALCFIVLPIYSFYFSAPIIPPIPFPPPETRAV